MPIWRDRKLNFDSYRNFRFVIFLCDTTDDYSTLKKVTIKRSSRPPMDKNVIRIDLVKLIKYVLKHCWLPILLAAIGFGYMYYKTEYNQVDTYTASGTMYVYNNNPNLVNYQYASSSDLDSALRLINTYMVVVRSNKVMDVIAERLSKDYPGIDPSLIAASVSMSPVSETSVVRVSSVTWDPQLSTDICNAVLDVAPAEILRVVGAGNVEVIDYASVPLFPNARGARRKGMIGGLAGGVLGCGILLILFLMNRKIASTKELEDNYTPPVLATIKRMRRKGTGADSFLLTENSNMETQESYAKLRMNLLYTLAGKKSHAVVITSAISGEGKSTIAANMALSFAMSDKKTLLIDGDLRRGCQREIFEYESQTKGLSEILIGDITWQDGILHKVRGSLDILPSGQLPPNAAELLGSAEMVNILAELEKAYDMILIDMPPVNIVSDPLVLSAHVAECLIVIRQNYSDHRDVRKALIAAEMTDMNVAGFIFYGEKTNEGNYYNRRYYKNYYKKNDQKNDSEVTATKKKPTKKKKRS